MIDAAAVRAKFPGAFDGLSDAAIDSAIAEAVLMISADKWGDWYDLGLLYLTAHLLSLFNPDSDSGDAGAAGPVTSKRVGDVAVSYGFAASASPSSDTFFNSTIYGQRYLSLRLRIQGGPLVVQPGP